MRYRQAYASGADFSNGENHVDVVDPSRHAMLNEQKAAAEETTRLARAQLRYSLAAKKPPKHISTEESVQRKVGFIVMDYRL